MPENTQENKPADIVIAEDSPVQLETLKYVLEKKGHRVRSGTNGKQALELIRSAPPDLVISDVI
ncbi:MAG: response regulator, partial [Methanoregula sp.]|nr:response regulator [Methanoregula sp.]